MYRLTKEGEKYLTEGLPERKLIEKLKAGPISFDDAKKMNDLPIAISWAKKNGWMKLTEGMLELTEAGEKALGTENMIERGLKEISGTGKSSEAVVKALLSRKLIEESREREEFSGDEIAQLTPDIIISRVWENIPFKQYDVRAPAPAFHPGKKQLYRSFLDDVKRELIAMGFQEMEGPLVEMSFFNMDALYTPQDHPARGIHDVYFVKNPKYGHVKRYEKFVKAVKKVHTEGMEGSKGWGIPFSEKESSRLVLRSHGTSLSARTLIRKGLKIPGAYFAVARTFRPEKLDATHLMEFNQLEGIVLNENMNFRNLLGLLKEFARIITGTDKVKFRPAYFPFTEPSVQGMIWHEEIGDWIEIMPAGIFRPELTKPLGIDVPVLAWGFGVDRLFMIKEGITDMRQLFAHDLKFLRDSKVL